MPQQTSLFDAGHQKRTGFDFSLHMRRLCQDVVTRLPEFAHVDLSRVAIACSQTRKAGPYGVHASLTPMRFADGRMTEKRKGRCYAVQRLRDREGHEILYVLTFLLPRFADGSLEEKLTTLIHELWHISPLFDGDIRRHPGRCHAHTGSQKNYDAQMLQLARRWLQLDPPTELFEFLKHRFSELQQIHGPMTGTRITRPKLLPVSAADARAIEQRASLK